MLYEVKQGDCVSSIAGKHGMFWETIWNHSQNSELKHRRGDPNVLHPGDSIFIPEKELKEEPGDTEQRHRFRRKGVPAKLRLRLLQDREEEEQPAEQETSSDTEGGDDFYVAGDPENVTEPPDQEPRANVPYRLVIDGISHEGQTDDDGMIEIAMPENAREGELILHPGTEQEERIELNLGNVNPIEEVSGVKQRLANLNLYFGEIDESETPELEEALRLFQQSNELEVTGRIDQSTKDKLVEVHGC